MKFKTTIRLCAGLLTAGALGAAPALAQEVVKIGYTGPLSGGAAQYGKNVLSGMEMAVKEVNDAGGFDVAGKKYKLELVALDDKYNPSEAATNTQRLVQQHKTPAVLTPHSGGIFAMQAINEQLKVLVLGYSSVPQITARGNKLTLRIPPEYTVYIKPFIEQTMAKFGKNVAIASADHDYGKAWVAAFKPAWEAAGGKVVAENLMSYNRATDFYSGVSRVLAAKPDLMFIGGASEPTGLVIKQARELGFKGGFMIIDQAKIDEIAKITGGLGPLEGAVGVLPVVDDQKPAAKDFVARYRKFANGRDPGTEAMFNYTAVHVTVDAMKPAGTTTDAMAIRANLDKAFKAMPPSTNPFGFTGVDDKGGTTANGRIAVVEGGKVKEIAIK